MAVPVLEKLKNKTLLPKKKNIEPIRGKDIRCGCLLQYRIFLQSNPQQSAATSTATKPKWTQLKQSLHSACFFTLTQSSLPGSKIFNSTHKISTIT